MRKPKKFAFIKSRLAELTGLALFLSAIFFIVSFLSYDPQDPSLNNANDNSPLNLAGAPGAYLSGPLLSLFGIGSVLFVIVPMAWGWILLTDKSLPRWWLRISMFILCLPFLSSAFSIIDNALDVPETWPSDSYGGVIGAFIKSDLMPILTYPGFAAFSIVFSLVTLYLAMGLMFSEWVTVVAFTYLVVAAVWNFFAKIISKISGKAIALKNFENMNFKFDLKNFRNREGTSLVTIQQDNEKTTIVQPKKSLIEISRKKPKVIKKEPEQTSLDLRAPNSYELPPLTLLRTPPARSKKNNVSENALEQNARMLEKVLEDFGVFGKITKVRPGPVVTLYELEPSPGTKSSRVIGLSDDIARSMSAVSARIAVIPGHNAIGIELPNIERETVYFRSLLETDEYQGNKQNLGLVLGKTLDGEPYIMDLAKMPHLLIAGTTGSGKSVGINAMILSILFRYTPDECRFIMVDPKMLELSVYDGIPHLLSPVVTEPGKAVVALKWTVKEMENRYRLMSNLGVRNIDGYNKRIAEAKANGEELMRTVQTGFDVETGKPTFEKVPLENKPLPFIVVVVDEMADLMIVAGKDIEASVQRLAQMARAAGIHIIMATQRPSVDVITGVIKANFPTRISFQVTSRIDSRTILGEQGAEQLLGMGDMLYMAGGSRITRVHGPYVDDKEVEKVVNFWKKQGDPVYIEEVTTAPDEEFTNLTSEGGSGDDLYDQAVQIVTRDGRASTSYIQRCLKIGYNRAATIIEQMEKEGVVSAPNHSGKREVLVNNG